MEALMDEKYFLVFYLKLTGHGWILFLLLSYSNLLFLVVAELSSNSYGAFMKISHVRNHWILFAIVGFQPTLLTRHITSSHLFLYPRRPEERKIFYVYSWIRTGPMRSPGLHNPTLHGDTSIMNQNFA